MEHIRILPEGFKITPEELAAEIKANDEFLEKHPELKELHPVDYINPRLIKPISEEDKARLKDYLKTMREIAQYHPFQTITAKAPV